MTENSNDSKYRKYLNRLGDFSKKNPGTAFNVASGIFMPVLNNVMRQGQKKFENTKEGAYLRNRANEGMGLATENAMLRRTARNVMPVVNDARARYSGMIAKNNLGGSISSARGLADIQSKGVDALSNVQETIAEKDIAIRESARDEYEMKQARDEDERSASKRGVLPQIVSNLTGIGSDYFKQKQDKVDRQNLNKEKVDALYDGQDPDFIKQAYMKLLGSDKTLSMEDVVALAPLLGLTDKDLAKLNKK